jgi:phosphoenolpyruvate---glycerone phosphotransferase subunit DhaL
MPMSSMVTTPGVRSATDASLRPLVRAWLLLAAHRIVAEAPRLTELDARIGDGDHGINLGRGMGRLRASLAGDSEETAADVLRASGRLLVATVGGASGPLYGTLFLEAADGVDDEDDPRLALSVGLTRGVEGVGRRGRSTVGQKTMLDSLSPAAAAFAHAVGDGASIEHAAAAAASAARDGCELTRDMLAQRGRASYLGERAIGHVDPGAASSVLLIEALHAAAVDQPPASASTAARR